VAILDLVRLESEKLLEVPPDEEIAALG